mmetsp:Transcript_134897/g.190712  ORF Transcript_134897/g.190712 Transcript_134897/m.190712 type:complete len:96 (+) Transcript_134897:163-450(+)
MFEEGDLSDPKQIMDCYDESDEAEDLLEIIAPVLEAIVQNGYKNGLTEFLAYISNMSASQRQCLNNSSDLKALKKAYGMDRNFGSLIEELGTWVS